MPDFYRYFPQSNLNRACHGKQLRASFAAPRRNHSGFTLIEVILAVSIAVGILTIALYFYKQAERLRSALLTQTAQISAARLLLDRLAIELNTLAPLLVSKPSLVGGSSFLQILKVDPAGAALWTRAPDPALTIPSTPFRLVRYSMSNAGAPLDAQPGTGLTRSEEVFQYPSNNSGDTADIPLIRATAILTSMEQLQFLRFRFFDGVNWLDAWTGAQLPAGVEVSIGFEPLPEQTSAGDYPFEYFRRVIAIPASGRPQPTNRSITDDAVPLNSDDAASPAAESWFAAPDEPERRSNVQLPQPNRDTLAEPLPSQPAPGRQRP